MLDLVCVTSERLQLNFSRLTIIVSMDAVNNHMSLCLALCPSYNKLTRHFESYLENQNYLDEKERMLIHEVCILSHLGILW